MDISIALAKTQILLFGVDVIFRPFLIKSGIVLTVLLCRTVPVLVDFLLLEKSQKNYRRNLPRKLIDLSYEAAGIFISTTTVATDSRSRNPIETYERGAISSTQSRVLNCCLLRK